MDKAEHGGLVIGCIVVLLALAAFSCTVASEFKKVKAKDVKLDGRLCSLPRSPAFGLGIAALVCLFVSLIVGTSAAIANLCSWRYKSGPTAAGKRSKVVAVTLLLLSWISFGLAAILLGVGSSMNNRQAYGKGWLDGKCYIVKDGVYVGAAALVVTTTVFTLGFMHAMRARIRHRTGPEDERSDLGQQNK